MTELQQEPEAPQQPPSIATASDRDAVCSAYFGPGYDLLHDERTWRETGVAQDASSSLFQRLGRLAEDRARVRLETAPTVLPQPIVDSLERLLVATGAPDSAPAELVAKSDLAAKLAAAFRHTDKSAGSNDDPWVSVAETALSLLSRPSQPVPRQSFCLGNQRVYFLEGEWRALDTEAGTGDEGYYAHGSLQHVADEALEAEVSGRSVDASQPVVQGPVQVTEEEWIASGRSDPKGGHTLSDISRCELRNINKVLAQRPSAPDAGGVEAVEAAITLRWVLSLPADMPLGTLASEAGIAFNSAKIRATKAESEVARLKQEFVVVRADCERQLNDWQDTHEQEVESLKQELEQATGSLRVSQRVLATVRDERERLKQELAETSRRLKQRSADLEATTVRKATAEQAAVDWQARAEAAEKRAAEAEASRNLAADRERDSEKRAAELERKLEAALQCATGYRVELDKLRTIHEGAVRHRTELADANSGLRVKAEAAEAQLAEVRGAYERLREACGPFTDEALALAEMSRVEYASMPYQDRCFLDYARRIQSALAATKPAEGPKAGDVVTGEQAKAFMLANPGRRVRNTTWDYTYEARDGTIRMLTSGGPTDFDDDGHKSWSYTVLPLDPVKPAEPRPVEPDPDAPKDVEALPAYWDARRKSQGKPDLSRCAAELRVALGAGPSPVDVEALARAIKAVAALAKLKGGRWEDGEDIRLKGEVDAALAALDGKGGE